MSMDMRKAFDTVEYSAIFDALEQRGIPREYIELLKCLYLSQQGIVNDSAPFLISRGVKQGDVLSAILFNCVLDLAFDSWKSKLTTEGLYVGHGMSRLTIIRYADDILLYEKS